jgi:phospholipase/carboxylesterase
MTTLSGPMLAPLSGGEPKQLVVLLHGYGSDGSDLIALGRHWQELLPDALFVSPNAPDACSENQQGYQWFALDLNRSASRLTGLPLARPIVVEFLKALWAQTGLSAKDTILAGFSQGAMMALHVGTSLEEPLLGVIAFSGAFVEPEGFMDGNKARPPICLVHGDLDNVVDPAYSAQAAEQLSKLGFEVNYHVSQGVGHGISPDGLAFASAFIAGLSATL